MIDLHSHILPNLDDGSKDWETSIEMCRIAYNDGIAVITATPHILEGVYNNDRKTILNYAGELKEKIKGVVELEILIGADVHLTPNIVERVKKGEIPTINNKNYLLLEISSNSLPINLEEIIFELRLAGIFPIITHPERNTMIQHNPKTIYNLVNKGSYIQITGMSLTGQFGKKARKCAEELLKTGLVHNISTDAHSSESRPPLLSPAVKKAKKIVGERIARMLVEDLPQKIIQGEEINEVDLTVKRKKWFLFK